MGSINRTSRHCSRLRSQENGLYLLLQKKQVKVYGLWNTPTGHIDKAETIEQAVVWEVKEKTGYDIELGDEIALHHESIGKQVKHVFSANMTGGNIVPREDEILDVQWLTFNKIKSRRNQTS